MTWQVPSANREVPSGRKPLVPAFLKSHIGEGRCYRIGPRQDQGCDAINAYRTLQQGSGFVLQNRPSTGTGLHVISQSQITTQCKVPHIQDPGTPPIVKGSPTQYIYKL